MARRVTKAVIAAAGFGTRFLPQTKAMPKEMLPIVDKPIIQYIAEQLAEAGIKDIIIVGSSNKRSIEDHFDWPNEDLLNNLRAGGEKKAHYIKEVEDIANLANFIYIRQKGPYGTATPVMNAAHLIGDEPFIYAYADDLTESQPNPFQQMIALYEELDASILPCIEAKTDKDFESYGILDGEHVRDGVMKMSSIVEKPGRDKASSNFASVGGYLLTPDVLNYLEDGRKNLETGKEFYLTDSVIQPMLAEGKEFYGCVIQNGKRYDTGDKLEYVKTVVDFALKHKDISEDFRDYLKQLEL